MTTSAKLISTFPQEPVPKLRKAMIRLIMVPPEARMLNSRTRKSRVGLNNEWKISRSFRFIWIEITS